MAHMPSTSLKRQPRTGRPNPWKSQVVGLDCLLVAIANCSLGADAELSKEVEVLAMRLKETVRPDKKLQQREC